MRAFRNPLEAVTSVFVYPKDPGQLQVGPRLKACPVPMSGQGQAARGREENRIGGAAEPRV